MLEEEVYGDCVACMRASARFTGDFVEMKADVKR